MDVDGAARAACEVRGDLEHRVGLTQLEGRRGGWVGERERGKEREWVEVDTKTGGDVDETNECMEGRVQAVMPNNTFN